MNALQDACTTAIANARALIAADRRFPRNVFVGDWADFFFFDSDWVFDVQFVQRVKDLLDAEEGTCACLLSLDSAAGGTGRERLFLIDQQTMPNAYQSLLSGDGPESGWVYDVARYGCTSDKGVWCIYCEQASEIGVVGFRRSSVLARYLPSIAEFHAARLDEAIKEPLSYGFSERALSVPWRRELLHEYAPRSL
jgi:hypothetical protein